MYELGMKDHPINISIKGDAFKFALGNMECQLVALFFFAIILILGSYLLGVVINYVTNHQYATLLDYLTSIMFCVLIFTNFSGFLLWGLRSVFGPLPLKVCQGFSITDSSSGFILTVVLNQFVLLKLLYVTCWKSVGQLNDDVFFEFFKATNITFVILHAAAQILCDEYLTEIMVFCTGNVEAHYVEGKLHFNNYFGVCSILFWTLALLKIWHQDRKVASITGTRLVQGFQFHIGLTFFLIMMALSRIPNVLSGIYLDEGTLDRLPQALTIPLATTLSRVVMSVILPLMLTEKRHKLRARVRRGFRKLLCLQDRNLIA